MRRSFAIWTAVVAMLVVAGCSSAPAEKKTEPAPAPAATTETKAPEKVTPSPKTLPDAKNKLGDTVTLGSVKLTVNSVRLTDTNGDKKAPEGYIFLIVNATVENTGKANFMSNTLTQTVVQAGNGVSFDKTAYTDLKGSLDGDIAPGAKLTGEVAFRVPKATKGYRLNYTPDLLKPAEMAEVALGETP